ncbi:MAG: hypothetical protein SCALA702_09870 [Melioribacteraceae bacterium]|nr:MAG: hypothetical protein SCALA702_09870 [Melioribacteraceae bacterium]
MLTNVSFAYGWMFWFMLLIPLLVFRYIRAFNKQTPDITFSSLKIFEGLKPGLKERLRHLPFILRMLALTLMIVALARPQTFSTGENVYTEGIDVAMLLDISGSMLAEDFKPNRLDAAKDEIEKFIAGRTTDKIGLVIFAKESFTQCPLTIDYQVLKNLLGDIESGMLEDGTAIGNAIANGVNRLKDSDAKSKVIILLTDGENNAGEIDPITAAQIAKEFGIRIYAIGVGSNGTAPYPVKTPFGTRYQQVPVKIDEETLTEISNITDGKYYRATSNKKLEDIYKEIDELEKTRVEITSYRQAKELFYNWVAAALFLLLLELILVKTWLRRIP